MTAPRIKTLERMPHLASLIFGRGHFVTEQRLRELAELAIEGIPIVPVEATEPEPRTGKTVRVIDLSGTLVNRAFAFGSLSGISSYERIGARIDEALADPGIGSILLRLDTPGGEVSGAFDLGDKIAAAAKVKPLWTVVDDMAASAGQLLAACASRTIVSRTSTVGSIGVAAVLIHQTRLDEKIGLKYHVLSAGEGKDALNPHTEIRSEDLAPLQAEVDRLYGLFVGAVADRRPVSEQQLRKLGATLVFGPHAVEAGLADSVGSFEETVEEIRTEGGKTMAKTTTTGVSADTGASADAAKGKPEATVEKQSVAAAGPTAPASATVEKQPAATASTASSEDDKPGRAAEEIAVLCRLARKPGLVGEFIEKGLTLGQARSELLNMLADEDEAIGTDPTHTGSNGGGGGNLVMKHALGIRERMLLTAQGGTN